MSCWELLRAQTHWKGIIICDCACTSRYETLETKLFPIIMPSRHGAYYLRACSEALVSSDWPLRTAKKTNRRYNSQLNIYLQTNKQTKDQKKSVKRDSYKYTLCSKRIQEGTKLHASEVQSIMYFSVGEVAVVHYRMLSGNSKWQ